MKAHLAFRRAALAAAGLGLAALACNNPSAPASATVPVVQILSPTGDSSVLVGMPVTVQTAANDPSGPGVLRLEMTVDNVLADSLEAESAQVSMVANLTFTPSSEGAVAVSVVAYREDGTASSPAIIALMVVGATTEDTPSGGGESGAVEAPPPPRPPEPTEARVGATANVDVNIRDNCGPGCPIIGVWRRGDSGDLLVRTTSPTQWWYWTDYLSPNLLGCVYQGQEQTNFTLLDDDSVLPREPEQGCLYCGDGVCTASIDEACNTCEEDCGPCCGNGVCEPQYGEACDVCVPDCGVCPFCGDGDVNQDWEECEDGGCDTGYECQDCLCVELDSYCGDGNCDIDAGEGCTSCVEDCPVCVSDLNAKENFGQVDELAMLQTLDELPITTWNYIEDGESVRHMGPMAQDFYSAFGLGTDDTTIHMLDANGVTMAAIKALYDQMQEKDALIAEQEGELAAIEARLVALEEPSGSNRPQALFPAYALAAAAFVAGLAIGQRTSSKKARDRIPTRYTEKKDT